MWSNYFMQEEDSGGVRGVACGTRGGARGGVKRGDRGGAWSDSQEGKVKLAFFVAIVGVTLTMLAVGTEFWVELSPPKSLYNNDTCPAAHFGLWKKCFKLLWVSDIDPERESCGPAELPGEVNCTYFKFFTTGENAVIFQKTTKKELSIAAAVLCLLSITMMILGSMCITMALSKGVEFLLKPASFFFILAGVLVLISLEVFRQSVYALLSSDHTVPLHHEFSWSVVCAGVAGAVLIFGGVCFIILSLPTSPWEKCLHKDGPES
ncbi:voltage-dependent calcium channel gamma-6 subunit [Acipenser ruthenus]|uniref:voltage-dependent calcium channel gamma-6 subunit n=1 Tax=Acipenser ruthenus TaxID=7906 RepID=UPI002741092D|nr:voltage-dependent calcium channel gamma-6 subunit [Acipenser ruthenus]XP_058874376.1 voltage-dependent calcium channel gamma-6 subunit [Acipenser ruthenus]